MAGPIIMHVNYVEQGQTIDEMCERAVRWGYDGIEFRRRRFEIEEPAEGYIDAIASARDKYGLKHVLFGAPGPDLMQPDADVRQRELDEFVAFYRMAAKRFDLTVCNAFTGNLKNPDPAVDASDFTKHGSYIATDDHYRWAAEGYRVAGALAEELGFLFAFETHMVYLHDIVSSTMRLLAEIGSPAVGVNLDYGNIVAMPDQPALPELLDEAGDRLYYVHLKNSYGFKLSERIRASLAEGDVNHRQYLRLLKERGYTGPLCIEAPRPGDREWFAQEDLAYLRAVLVDIGY